MKKIFILSLLLFINLQLLFSQEIIQLLQQTQKSEENIPKDLYLPYTQISIVEINPLLWEERSIKLDDKISIDLFENDSYLATIDRISKNVNGTLSIRARLEDYKWGYLILSVTNDMVLAKVKIPEKNEQYSIKTNYFTKETYLKKIDIPNLDIIESGPDIIPPEIRNIDDDKIAYLKEIAKKNLMLLPMLM